jgi:hypothetical protein
MKSSQNALVGTALIGVLLALLCWRIWGFGIAHTDDAVWALEAHQRHANTVRDWAQSQGRLWARPIGALMLHALRWQGTFYGELLRTASFAQFFLAFHVMVAVYCGQALALLTATLILGLFVLTMDGSILVTYPLLVWPSATCFCIAALMARRYRARGGVVVLALTCILLFASLFNNEGMTLLFCAVFGLTIWANDRQLSGVAKPRWTPVRHGRSAVLAIALLGAAVLYLAASLAWKLRHPSGYDGHVLGSFWPAQFGSVLLSFASANTAVSWLFRPYEIVYSDTLGGFGTRVSYSVLDALIGISTAPLAGIVGIVAAGMFFRSALATRNEAVASDGGPPPYGPAVAMVLGISIAFIHILPVSVTAKYQAWHFQQNVLAYPTSMIGHFGLCLFMAGAIATILRLPWRSVAIALSAFLCLGFGLLAAVAYRGSDQIAADMRLETSRWRIMAAMLPGLDLLAPEARVLFAPRLAGGSWFVTVPPGYWSEFVAARYGRALSVKTDLYDLSDLQNGAVTLDYLPIEDDRSFAIMLSRHRRPPAAQNVDTIDAVAVKVERATNPRLAQYVLAFRSGRGTASQVSLADLPAQGDGTWRVAAGIDAVPSSIRLQRRTQIVQSRLACSDGSLTNTLVAFGSAITSSGLSCMGSRYLAAGWGPPEAASVWSVADKAELRFPMDALPAGVLEAVLNASSFTGLGFASGSQRVVVSAAGQPLAEWTFAAGQPVATRLRIPLEARGADGSLDLSFRIHEPVQPSAVGISPDERRLGLNLCSIFFRRAEDADAPLPRSSCIVDTR